MATESYGSVSCANLAAVLSALARACVPNIDASERELLKRHLAGESIHGLAEVFGYAQSTLFVYDKVPEYADRSSGRIFECLRPDDLRVLKVRVTPFVFSLDRQLIVRSKGLVNDTDVLQWHLAQAGGAERLPVASVS